MKTIGGTVYSKHGICSWSIENNYAHIYNLYTRKAFRRTGIARSLVKKAMQAIRQQGYTDKICVVALSTEPDIPTDKLIRFYTGMGLAVFDYYG